MALTSLLSCSNSLEKWCEKFKWKCWASICFPFFLFFTHFLFNLCPPQVNQKNLSYSMKAHSYDQLPTNIKRHQMTVCSATPPSQLLLPHLDWSTHTPVPKPCESYIHREILAALLQGTESKSAQKGIWGGVTKKSFKKIAKSSKKIATPATTLDRPAIDRHSCWAVIGKSPFGAGRTATWH